MKSARFSPWLLFPLLLAAGCATQTATPSTTSSTPAGAACVPAVKPEFSYILTGYAVSMFAINSCTGEFTASTPASIATGYSYPANPESEQMVTDPLGRFAYVANPVSNASDLATISMFTINPTTRVLTPTSPATVPTGFYPQGIVIDPLGRFVYTANTDDATVSMFTINQTTGVLIPTTPASVSTLVAGNVLSQADTLTIDPAGKFLYVPASLSTNAAVLIFSIDQATGLLTPASPATVPTFGIPFQIVISPNGKFAYEVNNLSGGSMTDGVAQYTVNPATGVLTQNTPEFVAAGNSPTAIAIDPTSHYAYVVNRLDNTVSMYAIDQTTGNLTLNTGENSTGTASTGSEPFRISFDATGKFLYVTNEGTPASFYTVNSGGTLDLIGSTGVAGLSTAFTAP